jgi:hypothetical protein
MYLVRSPVDDQRSDHAPVTYSENAVTLAHNAAYGVFWAERLDAATGLPTLDAPTPKVEPPEGGWGEDTCDDQDGRRVRPLDAAIRAKVIADGRKRARRKSSRARVPFRAPGAVTRRSRQRRYRRTRRTRRQSRDGPSDGSEGDGEPPPGFANLAAAPALRGHGLAG